MKVVRTGLVAAATSAIFVGGFAAPAQADTRQDGLVNVNVEDNEILSRNDVNVAVIASVVANICDAVDVGPVAAGVLGRATAVDNSGRDQTICTANGSPVTLTQNN